MKPVDQKHTVNEHGWGDCLSACVASIVECPLGDVPQFNRVCYPSGRHVGWTHHLGAWLRDRGFCAIMIRNRRAESYFLGMEGVHVIVGGPSNRAKDGHAVVGRVADDWGEITLIHDPHPSREFLHGDPDEWIFILPLPKELA